MSSIDQAALGATASALFEALTTGAAALSAEQKPFPLGPDPRLSSYYTQRSRPAMAHEDFLSSSCLGADEFGQRLAAYWRAAGHPELAEQAPLVAEAAAALHALHVQAQPQAEVSPYIYQMF